MPKYICQLRTLVLALACAGHRLQLHKRRLESLQTIIFLQISSPFHWLFFLNSKLDKTSHSYTAITQTPPNINYPIMNRHIRHCSTQRICVETALSRHTASRVGSSLLLKPNTSHCRSSVFFAQPAVALQYGEQTFISKIVVHPKYIYFGCTTILS